MDPHEAAVLLATTDAVALDVRKTREWKAGRLADGLHIPLENLESRLNELPGDRTIVVVCRSGKRSAIATAVLRRAGYRAENMEGGLKTWKAAGLPLEPRSARID